MLEAVVLAAGEGRRLRPITERWPKPLLPIDGRPVLATLLRELSAAGIRIATVVTGHLADQIETLVGDGRAYGVEVRTVRQPSPDGSADAIVRAGVEPPYLVTAADTDYGHGDVRMFLELARGLGRTGAIAVRRQAGRPVSTRIRVADGHVVRVVDPTVEEELTAAPLLLVGRAVAEFLPTVTRRPYQAPYEVAAAFQLAIAESHRIAAIEIGPTRDLTSPIDLVEHNFDYLVGP